MLSLGILLFSIFLVSVKSFTPNAVQYSDYNSAGALINYLAKNTYYYTPNSLFFQFDWYITQDEVAKLLAIMTEIYNAYGLNGVFLILDARAGISDINTYSAEVCKQLEYQMGYKRDYMYIVIIQYTVPDYYKVGGWELSFSITTGGSYARHYLPDSDAKKLINTYGPYLKSYTYDNMYSLVYDIKVYMNSHANDEWVDDSPLGTGSIIIIVIVVLVLLCCGGGGGYYYKKRSEARTNDMGGGIHVNSGQF